jgi:hypothetical protein
MPKSSYAIRESGDYYFAALRGISEISLSAYVFPNADLMKQHP